MARKAEGLSRRRIEAAMRLVDSGKSDKETIRDATVRGLSLAIGRATQRWVFEFKAPRPGGGWSGGRRLVLGDLADMDIEAARAAALAAKKQVSEGVDPSAAKRARRALNIESGGTRTLRAATEKFIEERSPDWTTATRSAYARDLKLICEALDADAPLVTIERGALVGFIEDHLAEARRKGTAGLRRAVRLADLLGQLWRQAGGGTASRPSWHWPGVDPHVADQLPVPGRHRITSRSRVLSETEIRKLWAVLAAGVPGSRVGPAPRLALMLNLASGLRIGAIALCRVADLDLDPEPVVGARDCGPTITLPAADGRKFTAQARREGASLILPLSPLAVRLFKEALALRSGPGSPFVFPGARPGTSMSPATVGHAYRKLVDAAPGAVPADATPHDLRRTMRTMLGELDHNGSYEDEERLIGHVVGGTSARVYDRGRRLARLRPLTEAWSARLEQIVGGQPAEVRRLQPA